MAPSTFPEPSLQGLLDELNVGVWWVRDSAPAPTPHRGRLAWSFIPLAEPIQRVLEPAETPNTFRLVDRAARHREGPTGRILNLPNRGESVWGLHPCKRRPVLVLGEGGKAVDRAILRSRRASQWRYRSTLSVAPYYTVSGGTTGSYPEAFVRQVQRCAYPQFVWDRLPPSGEPEGSILRLDQLQPIGQSDQNLDLTPYRLSDQALALLDTWLRWCLSGELDARSDLAMFRQLLQEGV